MYRFPNCFTFEQWADNICKQHINNVLLMMVNRHIDNLEKVEVVGEEAVNFFPEEVREYANCIEFVSDKFFTLRTLLMEEKEYTPELLLEYVIAKMSSREEYYTRYAVFDALVNVIQDDDLNIKIDLMFDRFEIGLKQSEIIEYDFNNVEPRKNVDIWAGRYDVSAYYNNIRLMIKEMLERVKCKRGRFSFTKKESLKFLNMISMGIFDDEFSFKALENEHTAESDFVLDMYIKKFGHPAIYRLNEDERKHVVKVLNEESREVLEECVSEDEEVSTADIYERVNEIIENIEDTRLYDGSEYVFWDWDYTFLDTLGVDGGIDFISDVMGDGPSVGGIRY